MLTAVLAVCIFSSHAHALKGDANGDGMVNVQDARLVADYLVGNVLSIPRPEDADVNGDGQITTADALLILQFAKGLRTSFDFQAPLVLTVLPAVGSTNVLLTTNISIFFSEPISPTSLGGALTIRDIASGLPVSGRIERSQEGVIATFFPDQPLNPLTTYRVDVTTGVMDNEDNPLQQAFSGTFQTQSLGVGVLVSTNNLSAPINELAPQPIVFKALNAGGSPVRQVPVTFTARMGSGVFEPSKKRQVTVVTDDAGIAQASFRLGGEAVLHTVDVTAVGFSTVPKFTALALPLPAVNLRVYSGDSQNGAPGLTAPFPLIVHATDAGGNSVAATPVTFTVSQGQGNFGGEPTAVIATDSSGTARTQFTFGAAPGPISVQANFPSMVGQAPTFSLLNLEPQPSSPTLITGRVIDSQTLRSINNIYVYLVDNPTTWDWTDEFGAFSLPAAPGSHVVSVNGFESGPIDGNLYPVIAIPVNAVEGQVNDIGMPALMPRLDSQSYIDVSDAQGGTLTLRANPLWQMYVGPGQTRFANGTGTGRLYVASVPPDRIPMPVAGGKTSRFFDTIQPLNVVFDPPAQVSFPNTDNLRPGTVTDIFTLSYTSGTFVRTGRGQVSEDGNVVRSLPGEGITHGGWHSAPPPIPSPLFCIEALLNLGPNASAPTMTAFGKSTNGVPKNDFEWFFELCGIPADQGPIFPIVDWENDDGGPYVNGDSPEPPYDDLPDDPPPPKGSQRPKVTGITLEIDKDAAAVGDEIKLTATVQFEDPNASKQGVVVTFSDVPGGIIIYSDAQVPGIADSNKETDNQGKATITAFMGMPVAGVLTEAGTIRVGATVATRFNPAIAIVATGGLLLAEKLVRHIPEYEMDGAALRRGVEADPLSSQYKGVNAPATGADIINLIDQNVGRVFFSPEAFNEFLVDPPVAEMRADHARFLARHGVILSRYVRNPALFVGARAKLKSGGTILNESDATISAWAVANGRRLVTLDKTIHLRAGEILIPGNPESQLRLIYYQDNVDGAPLILRQYIPAQ